MWLFFEGRPQRVLLALLAIIILILSFVGIVQATNGSRAVATEEDYKASTKVMADFVFMTNALRRKYSLNELKPSGELEASAYLKLDDMASGKYWGHYGPNKTSFSKFIWQELPSSYKVGENLARCFDNHEDAFKALVNSPTHFAVLTTTDFNQVGIASKVQENGCESIVMHFSN